MSFMADVLGLMWRHPLLLCVTLVLFTPPFYPVLRFFSPLLISTAVFLVVVLCFGPALERKAASRDGERHGSNVEGGRRSRHGEGNSRGFWEDHVKPQKDREERSWLEGMVLSLKIRLHAWLEQKLRNDDVLIRLGNEGPVNLLVEEEREASRSTSSRRSSLKSTSSDKDGSSSRRSRRGEVVEVRSTDTDDYSESEEEEHHRSLSRRSSSRRRRSGEVMEARSIGKDEASDDDGEGKRSARSRSSSRKQRSRKPGSRSNSGKGLKYDGDTEELQGGSIRPGEGVVGGGGGGRRERSRSKSRSNSRPKSSKSFRKYVEDSGFDTDEDARLQAEALARHQKSMSRSRANSRSNSGKSFRYEDSQNFSNEEDARVQQEAVEKSFSRSKSGSRSSKRDKYDEGKGLDSEEERQQQLASRARSNSGKGMIVIPQVVVDTDSDDEPRLVKIARRPSSRMQSHSNSFKVPAVSRSGRDEGVAARVEVEARLSDSRSGSRTSSRSNSGNGRNDALMTHSSETDRHSQIGEGHVKEEEVSAAAMRYPDGGSFRSSSGSGKNVSSAVEEDARGSQRNRSVHKSDSRSDSEAEVGKSRSGILRSSEHSTERIQSGQPLPEEEETKVPAASAKKAWQKHSEDEGSESLSSSEEEQSAPPTKGSSRVLPGRLVRALSRELKAHIDEKLVVPSDEPEKKVERLQTLHHEISGILNNFSIHEEEEKLASVLGGLSAFVQGGNGKEDVPRTELLPKRWSSKTYADVDILPQTSSVKRVTDSAKDSQKLEMLKLYGNLLQAERDNLTRQDSASSLA